MATHAPKLSKKASTVLLGDLLKELDLKKDDRGKIIDHIVKSSHMWSERHPERAAETLDPNVINHIMDSGIEVIGAQNTQAFSHLLHDVLDDFHYTIQDVITEGTIANGRAAIRSSVSGKWIKPVGETAATNEEIVINSLTLCNIKNGKTTEIWVNTTQPPHWKAAWDKFLSTLQKS